MKMTLLRTASVLAPLVFAGCSGRECYVGVRGAAASITVKGIFPSGTCEALIKNPVKYLGNLAEDGGRDLYSMSERPTQPVICEYPIDGKTFIVRDEGMLKVVGNLLCSGLGRRADRP